MKIEDFEKIYVAELQEVYSVEAQLLDALPNMIETASDKDLQEAMEEYLRQTRSHVERLEPVLKRHNAETRDHRDQSMQTIIAETGKWAGMVEDPACRDAGLIASAQRIEHYQIAVYGSLASWANQLGFEDDAVALHSNLEEEKAADEKLTSLAESIVNPRATA